jgi:hypothetical protein
MILRSKKTTARVVGMSSLMKLLILVFQKTMEWSALTISKMTSRNLQKNLMSWDSVKTCLKTTTLIEMRVLLSELWLLRTVSIMRTQDMMILQQLKSNMNTMETLKTFHQIKKMNHQNKGKLLSFKTKSATKSKMQLSQTISENSERKSTSTIK